MVNPANHYCCSESIMIFSHYESHEPWTDWLVQEPGSWIHNIFLHQLSWSLTVRPWKGESLPKHPFSAAVAVTLAGVNNQRFTRWFFLGLAMVSSFRQMGNWPTARKQIIPKIFHKMLQGRHQLSCIAWCGGHQFRPTYMFLYIPKWFQDFCNIFSTLSSLLVVFQLPSANEKMCSLKWVASSSPQILWIPQPWKSPESTQSSAFQVK